MERKVLLDLRGAAICGDVEERNPPISLPNQSSDTALIAVDIGGTLIKLVYFENNVKVKGKQAVGGRLRFMKFQTSRLDECLEFIRSVKLPYSGGSAMGSAKVNLTMKVVVPLSFMDTIKEKLGVSLDKLDEMDTVVTGANFLLKQVPNESFTFAHGKRCHIEVNQKNLYPYLLVNIGSGVSMIKVLGNRNFERVTGTQIGGGTMFGLAKLLTGCTRYDEFLQLSQQGDNLVLDLIVKDICGELVCQKQGLSASTLASSFGKVISSKRELSDYKAEDLATTLLSAFTYNIAQVSFLVASLLKLKRVYFGGSYIQGTS
ncbi:hypothetical protein HPP92_002311 [Vanilla planifolia]|uniref:Pantothenate kinase 1 n=1 Tax=Vanilla planifolia TaxID=51239 RepID=A0A835VIU7_VANPL|nr:hypothetical protein HPP92_002311 [Vanilla planifolia]